MRIEVKPIFYHREACILRQTSVLARSARITIFLDNAEGSLVPSSRTCSSRTHRRVSSPPLSGGNSAEVVIEQPPKVELGDFAIPLFPFAKPLRTAPLKLAEAIRAEIGPIEGIAEMRSRPRAI